MNTYNKDILSNTIPSSKRIYSNLMYIQLQKKKKKKEQNGTFLPISLHVDFYVSSSINRGKTR